METVGFAVVAAVIVGFGLISQRAQRGILTPPMVFVTLGVLVGPRALGLIDADLESGWVHLLAELALVVVLFTDASRIDLRLLQREHDLPVRMLLVGLPLTVVLGTVVGFGLFEFNIWEAAVLAAILAPTDAALGQAVVSDRRVPVRIRQALNVESGLNDGVMLPVLLVLLACAGAAGGAQESDQSLAYWVRFTALQVTLGPLVGLAVGYFGGKAVERASRAGWMNHTFQQLSALGLAMLAFSLAESVGGNGFIAAFCAGLAVGNFARGICSCVHEFGEAEGQLLTLLIFLVFGVVMVPIALDHFTPVIGLYALLSLTAVRMLPVALGLLGKRLRADTIGFLGWFGPRGIASILFALLVVEECMLSSREEILAIVATAVLGSVFLHGMTASPAVGWYHRRIEGSKDCAAESVAVAEMPLRHGD